MRILRVTQEFYPVVSGPAKQAYNISKQLIEQGHESPILTTNAGTDFPPGQEQIGPIPVQRIASRGHVMRCYFVPTLHKDLCLEDVDVLHVHGWRNYISDFSLFRARQASVPVVLHAHGTPAMFRHILPTSRQIPYRLYDATRRRAIIRAATALVVSTEQEKEEAIDYGFPVDRITVIPSGMEPISLPSLSLANGHGEDGARLLFVGRVSTDRNVEQVIEAVARLAQMGWPATLRIVGPEERRSALDKGGYVDSLHRLARSLGVERQVTFAGERRGSDLRDEYRNADVFVYTSRYENFGNSVLEAASYGLPIVTTPTGIGPELVKGAGFGAVVPLDDVDATAAALVASFRQKRHDNASQTRLLELISRRFTWDVIGQQYIALYGDLVDSSSRGSFAVPGSERFAAQRTTRDTAPIAGGAATTMASVELSQQQSERRRDPLGGDRAR